MKKLAARGSFVAIFLMFAFLRYSDAQYSQLQGCVRWPNNQPVLGATVGIGGYAVSTDRNGCYSLGFLYPGDYVISISPPGRPTASFWIRVGPGSIWQDFVANW